MSTVSRPTPPRSSEARNQHKRKRTGTKKAVSTSFCSATLSASCSSVDAQLQTLENWHRAMTIDLRELRREGSRVRMELEKVDNTVESAVEKAEQCAVQAETAQEHVLVVCKAKDEALEETQRKLQAMEARHNAAIKQWNKVLILMDKKLERYKQSSINEEHLMTQLMQLQEQYENDLLKIRNDEDARFEAQQKALETMAKKLVKTQQEKKETTRLEKVEKLVHTLKDENARLSQRVRQMALRQEMYTLQQQIELIKREKQDEQEHTRVDLNTLKDRLVDVEKRAGETDNRVREVKKLVQDVDTRTTTSTPALPPQTPSSLCLPQDLVRQADLVEIRNVLQRINRDFQAVAVDFTSLAERTDSRGNQQEQHAEAKLQELSTQLFDALSHDSRLHAAEISRLKDTVFDVQNNYCEFGQRVRRLEDDVQHVTTARAQARSPQHRGGRPGWRYGPNLPLLATPPQTPPPVSFRNHQERPSRYEPALAIRKNLTLALEPSPPDRITRAPRGVNRSRSRSPPRRLSWGAFEKNSLYSDSGPAAAAAQIGRHYRHDGQRHRHGSYNGVNAATNPPLDTIGSPQGAHGDTKRDAAEHNYQEQSTVPVRRNRQPRKTPEVIVIEEDDDEDDEEAARAPPDVVSDEEVLQPDDVVMVASQDISKADNVETDDLLQKEGDLQTGFWLYFCLGGAPDLDIQWTTCFTQLKADECVEMPRVLRFQRRYAFLQSFPLYLTQCILQAVIVNGQIVAKENGPAVSGITGTLNGQNILAKFDDVVREIHLLWAKTLVEYLTKRASAIDDLDMGKLELSVNPAGLSSAADNDDVIYGWSRRQESAMWILARQLHYRSLLPAMVSNVGSSPSVYLFTLMFDVLAVTSECPQSGTFRLNDFGGTLVANLWDYTLKKLPYVFFADWAWLEDQSTKMVIPASAFCHLLASILLWNSAIDRHSLTNCKIYAAGVKHLLPKLYVGGQPIHESTVDVSSLQLAEWASTHIELRDLDSKFASMLGLDGFFEVTEAIQNSMQAAAAKSQAAST